MRIPFKSVILLAGLILASGCEKSEEPTKPPANVLPDTTSHDFTWQMDILGDGEASNLRDVCIINENDVWAVGEIYLKDSTGSIDLNFYNLARWDGQKWSLSRVYYFYQGNKYLSPLKSVFAFSFDNIWIGSTQPMHWNGQSWEQHDVANIHKGWIYKMWGISSNNLYLVGGEGSITNYDGHTWQKLESGTIQDIQDIWGAKDPVAGEYTILAVASNIFTSYKKEILQIKGTRVEKISTLGIDWPVDAAWFDPNRIYCTVGAGIYSKKTLDATESWDGPGLTVTTYTSHAIRGNHLNDVFIVGAFGDVLHYNGTGWCSYRETTALAQGAYFSVAVKGDWVFAVGENLNRAVVLRGKRMPKQN